MARDWSLVVFTVVGQAAVGLFLVAGGVLYFADGVPGEIPGRDFRLGLVLAVLGLLLAGVVSSFFHLHHPRRAFRAVRNVRSAWLSREVLSLLIFLALLAALAFAEWTGAGAGAPLRWLCVAAGLAGISFLACMARIYTLPAVPFWDRVATPLSFLLTAATVGTLGASLVFKLVGGTESFWKPWATASAVLVVAGLTAAVFLFPRYGLLDREEEPSLSPPGVDSALFHRLRLVLLALGAVLALAALLPAAFVSVLAGEILGRFLFYGLRGQAGRGAVTGS
jgi:DMSO reductase anchor subunit